MIISEENNGFWTQINNQKFFCKAVKWKDFDKILPVVSAVMHQIIVALGNKKLLEKSFDALTENSPVFGDDDAQKMKKHIEIELAKMSHKEMWALLVAENILEKTGQAQREIYARYFIPLLCRKDEVSGLTVDLSEDERDNMFSGKGVSALEEFYCDVLVYNFSDFFFKNCQNIYAQMAPENSKMLDLLGSVNASLAEK